MATRTKPTNSNDVAPPSEDRRLAIPEAPHANLAAWSVPRTIAEAISLAEVIHKSNTYPNLRNPGQVLLVIMAGAELGMGVFASLSDIPMVEGKPDPGAAAWGSTIRRSDRYDYSVMERTDTACELIAWELTGNDACRNIVRKGMPGWEKIGSLRYTLEEAQRKGWDVSQGGKVKTPWAKTPANMLFARALKDLKRVYFPDVGANTYSADELDVEEAAPRPAGEVIDASYTVSEPGKPEVVVGAEVPSYETPAPVVTSAAFEAQLTRIGELLAAGGYTMDDIDKILPELAKLSTATASSTKK